jgi:hypothetical protein
MALLFLLAVLPFAGLVGLMVAGQARHERAMEQMAAERHRGSHGLFNCSCHAHLNPLPDAGRSRTSPTGRYPEGV